VQLVSATIAPGDRSMPPVRITRVAPIAAIATLLTCNDTFDRFRDIRKRSVVKLTTNTASSNAPNGPATLVKEERMSLAVPDMSVVVPRQMSQFSQDVPQHATSSITGRQYTSGGSSS